MTDTIRIMNSPDDGYVWVVPTHPVYATRSETGDWILSDDSAVAFDAESAIGIDGYWHEVSDPIVWDCTEASTSAIANALPDPWELDASYPGWLDIWRMVTGDDDEFPWVRLRPGWRIRIEGDSFVILPPKDGDA